MTAAAHRSLGRLPLIVYTDLICERSDENGLAENPALLRDTICNKLKKFPESRRSYPNSTHNHHGSSHNVTFDSITTAGGLLTRISKPTLMRVLDPLLTYEECDKFLRRVAHACIVPPQSAWDLLQETEPMADLMNVPLPSSQPLYGMHNDPFHKMRHVPTGLQSLDECLRGGIRVGTITEFVGRAGVGKTQLAMQLCVMAARYRQGCIYMDTEKKLSLHRLQEIAEKRAAVFYNNDRSQQGILTASDTRDDNHHHPPPYNFSYSGIGNGNTFASASVFHQSQQHSYHRHHQQQQQSMSCSSVPYRASKEVLDNVTVLSPTTTSELMSALVEVEELILVRNQEAADAQWKARLDAGSSSLPHTTAALTTTTTTPTRFPVKLLIVDSIAAPSKRGSYPSNESIPERAAAVFQCAQRLKQLAHQLQIAVLVVNQVFMEQQQEQHQQSSAPQYQSHGNGTTVNHSTASNHFCSASGDPVVAVKAALGTSWHHCVSTRILLEQRQHRPSEEDPKATASSNAPNSNHNIRSATIVKSNVVGLQSTSYEVAGPGVMDMLH